MSVLKPSTSILSSITQALDEDNKLVAQKAEDVRKAAEAQRLREQQEQQAREQEHKLLQEQERLAKEKAEQDRMEADRARLRQESEARAAAVVETPAPKPTKLKDNPSVEEVLAEVVNLMLEVSQQLSGLPAQFKHIEESMCQRIDHLRLLSEKMDHQVPSEATTSSSAGAPKRQWEFSLNRDAEGRLIGVSAKPSESK